MVKAWDELVRRALLGTDRDPATLETFVSGELAAYVARFDPHDREGALIGTAALLALHTRGGTTPRPTAVHTVDMAPPENAWLISPRSTAHLAELLHTDQGRELLAEWLDIAAKNQRCVAPVLLPPLLEKGRRHPRLASRVKRVLGERGRWLARQNPAWRYATSLEQPSPEDFTERWETSSPAERTLIVAALREHDPGDARVRIEATWSSERVRDRAALLEAMSTGLSMADEPFLESCLDDRGKEVRRSAAKLLTHLPDSRLCQRMTVRTLDCVRVNDGRFVVVLPSDLDAAGERDGITRTTTQTGEGRRSSWLSQILGAAPPSALTAAWGRSPDDLLRMSAASDWARTLRAGFLAGAVAVRDVAWIEALILHRVEGEDTLWNLLPAERREAMFGQELERAKTRTEIHRVLFHLPKIPGPWAVPFSKQIVRAVGELVLTEERFGEFPAFGVLRDAGKKLAPQTLQIFGRLYDRVPPTSYWKKALADGLETLEHRERISSALAKD